MNVVQEIALVRSLLSLATSAQNLAEEAPSRDMRLALLGVSTTLAEQARLVTLLPIDDA
jgi:hypothetical protein